MELGQDSIPALGTDAVAEGSGGTFDLLVAIPAPTGTSAGLSGTYWVSSLELQSGSSSAICDAFFKATAASGSFGTLSVMG